MSAIQQAMLIIGSSSGVTGLLEGYGTYLKGAYALAKLNDSYSGSAIRVRRSSDDTEQDIGFSSNLLDTASLASFVGSSSAYITKWYDQSGLGNHLAQATASRQPMLVDSGTYLGEILTDGDDDALTGVNAAGTYTRQSVVFAGRARIGGGQFRGPGLETETVVVHSGGLERAYVLYYKGGSTSDFDDLYGTVVQTKVAGQNRHEGNMVDVNKTYGFRWDYGQVDLIDEARFFDGGVLKTRSGTHGSATTGDMESGAWEFGGSAVYGEHGRLAATALLIFGEGLLDSDFATFDTLLKPSNNYTGVFDGYTGSLWGVYSLRKQVSAYSGSAIRVRRSSDNTEQDIGFSSGHLDTASLLSFVGSGSGYVKMWYDQSGAGRHFEQTTTGKQPRIVNAGAMETTNGRPAVYFESSVMSTSATSGAVGAMTAYFCSRILRDGSVARMLLEHTANYNSNDGAAIYAEDYYISSGTRKNSPAGQCRNDFRSWAAGQALAAVWDRSQVTSALQCKLYSGGRLQTRFRNSLIGTLPTGNFANAAFNLGDRAGGGVIPAKGYFETVAIYTAAHDDATVERISRRLA